MRYSLNINQIKCLKWGINTTQGFVIDLLSQVHTWANPTTMNGQVYYFIARSKVAEELPLIFDNKKGSKNKFDSVYRVLKQLEKIGLIEYRKLDSKDMVRLTDLGKTWNKADSSEIKTILGSNSDKLGYDSESNSDEIPTYNTTIYDNTTIDNLDIDFSDELPSIEDDLPKEPKPKKIIVKSEDVDEIYKAYPTRCVVKGSATGKSHKNKEKIKTELRGGISKEAFLKTIERYAHECKRDDIYMMNFKTFLNNIPDYGEDIETWTLERIKEMEEKRENNKDVFVWPTTND